MQFDMNHTPLCQIPEDSELHIYQHENINFMVNVTFVWNMEDVPQEEETMRNKRRKSSFG